MDEVKTEGLRFSRALKNLSLIFLKNLLIKIKFYYRKIIPWLMNINFFLYIFPIFSKLTPIFLNNNFIASF